MRTPARSYPSTPPLPTPLNPTHPSPPPGADPSQELSEYAAATIGRDKYHEVAMGQGQAEVALQLLRECARTGWVGGWVGGGGGQLRAGQVNQL